MLNSLKQLYQNLRLIANFKQTMIIPLIFLLFPLLYISEAKSAQPENSSTVSGLIILQVELKGEAWYLNPKDSKRYYLGRPADALKILKKFAIGAKHDFIVKNPVFDKRYRGNIYIDVDDFGKAYYIYPKNGLSYYLGRPEDAFRVMSSLGIGISNDDISWIPIGLIDAPCPNCGTSSAPDEAEIILDKAAQAIRSDKISEAVSYFSASMKKSADYSLNTLSKDSKIDFADILSKAVLKQSSTDKKIYSSTAFFGLRNHNMTVNITMEKQKDGKWAIANI
jgi:hypothetical protein